MTWHNAITRFLTTTRLLGGDDAAPLNVPLKEIEDNLSHLKGRFALRTFRVNSDLSLTDYDALNGRIGDWDALTNSNTRQPIPANSLVLGVLRTPVTATAVTNPLTMQITCDFVTSGEILFVAAGQRWSATPAHNVYLDTSGFTIVRNADSLKLSKTNVDAISATSGLYLFRLDGIVPWNP